jgi:A/G-specific adenine glycosylase
MLQQTRVGAVIPYYERFLARFPAVADLAAAPENDVLAAWSGLGYYSRARNLQRAARQLAENGLPASFREVLALPGAGPYTAAAIASIALELPHAAVDGNVMRVISRLTNDAAEISSAAAKRAFAGEADRLLEPRRPGDFNQAMMELGATVCLPRTPDCGACPVERFCAGRAAGRERELPVRLKKPRARDVALELVLIESGGRILLVKRSASERRLAEFWELPERYLVKGIQSSAVAAFSQRIVNDRFRVTVWSARSAPRSLPGSWFGIAELDHVPLTTITKKALAETGRKIYKKLAYGR